VRARRRCAAGALGGTDYRPPAARPRACWVFDQALLWVVVALLAWGLVMVYSASIAMPDNPRFGATRHTHFLVRHAICSWRWPLWRR
jgi:cell division protein FtsW